MARNSFNTARALQGRRRTIFHSRNNNNQETVHSTEDQKPEETPVSVKATKAPTIKAP